VSQPTHVCRFCLADISHRARQARFCDAKCRDRARSQTRTDRWSRMSEASRENRRAYRRAHPERLAGEALRLRKEYQRQWQIDNRERINEQGRARWAKRRPTKKVPRPGRMCEYRDCSKELDPLKRADAMYCSKECSARESSLRWASRNPERRAVSARLYAEANRTRISLVQKNREARKGSALAQDISHDALMARFTLWGNKCWMCGGSFEHIEHVKPLSKGGPHILANLRPACAACNLRKGGRWYGVRELNRFTRLPRSDDAQSA